MVNREAELRRLRETADDAPELVVVRGRRRVGKSFLLDRALTGRRVVYLQADEQPERAQLALLAEQVASLMDGNPPLRFDTWDDALGTLEQLAGTEPLVVVLDEFQWLWEAQPSLGSIIQRRWDRWEREGRPLTLILCGSAITMMEELIAPASPLYGRAGYRPLVEPLGFRETAGFAASGADTEELLRRYAVVGGTPQYQVWAGRSPVKTVIERRILAKGEPLYEEPLHLLRGEQSIRDTGTYFAIVAAIASGQSRLGEIANRAGLPTSNLARMLGILEELGYVTSKRPVQARRVRERNTLYAVADPFFRFWFRYVFGRRSLLERGQVAAVMKEIWADLDNFMGPAFEDACREWVGMFAGVDPRIPSCESIGSWWSRDGAVEIDVVGMNGDRYVFLGSCKWSKRVGTGAIEQLRAARDHLGPAAKQAKLAVLARGFDRSAMERAGSVELLAATELTESSV